MLIESYARPGMPQWFREGLVLYLTAPNKAATEGSHAADLAALESSLRDPHSEQDLRRAYVEAQDQVAQLAQQHGKAVLLEWVQNGLPPELVARSSGPRASLR